MNEPKLTAKCTTCKSKWVMTDQQMAEARDFGCAFSPCCSAVATIERVEVKTSKRRAATPSGPRP